MTRDMLSEFFDRPLRQAAVDLGISPTALKSLCRKLEVSLSPPAMCCTLAAACALLERLPGTCPGCGEALVDGDVRAHGRAQGRPCVYRLCSVRDWQIVRWPFQNARWNTARAKKHGCDHGHNLAAPAPSSNIEEYGAQKGLEATNCASFSSLFEHKKPNAREQDHSLEQLLQFRFDEDDLQDPLPLTDILDGCNAPLTAAQGPDTSSASSCGRAAVDFHVHTYASNAPTRYDALQSRRPADYNARVPRDSWFGPPAAGHELNEYPLHSFASLSLGLRNSDVTSTGARDTFSNGPMLEARSSSLLRARPTPAHSAEFFEMGFTDCDLSYLVGSIH